MPDLPRLSLGDRHSLLLKLDGRLWVAGSNVNGQLGLGWTAKKSNTFWPSVNDVQAVSAGSDHSMVLKQDGSVWTAGRNLDGQLGDGSTTDRNTFVKVISGGSIAIAAGRDFSMVLREDGSVWTTGLNTHGQLGDGTTSTRHNFVPVVCGPATWVEGDFDYLDDLSEEEDDSEIGRLPTEKIWPSQADPPKYFRNMGGVEEIAAGGYHSVVLRYDGSVWSTGSNAYGQLGIGFLPVGDTPAFIKVLDEDVIGVAAGAFHTLVVKYDGSVWATGRNIFGQLGDGSRAGRATFTPVVPNGVLSVIAGHSYSMVVTNDGSACSTGSNARGQLGDGSIADRTNFVIVKYSGVVAAATGFAHSMYIALDGQVWATGWNSDGQFGDGSFTSTSTFVSVTRITDTVVRTTQKPMLPFSFPSVVTRTTTRPAVPGEKTVVVCLVTAGSIPAFRALCCIFIFVTYYYCQGLPPKVVVCVGIFDCLSLRTQSVASHISFRYPLF